MHIPDTLTGHTLGDILIQEPLGRGGMAHVYKGLDLSLKRPVAVKVIAEDWRGSEFYTRRFEQEAHAVAALKHPNIVIVFQFASQGDLYYLVMEYIDGVTLEAVLSDYEGHDELMPHADVLRILEAIGSALDYAHRQGVIHRDVKPSNIMLERDGRPVLTDFGLALRVREGTMGESFGSPHYIAPEQARSSANAVPQSDIYSLGVIAYEMLTGRVPFDDPSPASIITQHLTAPVPSARSINPNLSEDVEWVLQTALAKEPSARFETCERFHEELKMALLGLKEQPADVGAAEAVPPMAAGALPRRLSLQSAQDKLHQALALRRARGQTITRMVESVVSRAQQIAKRDRPGSDLVITVAALVIFAIAGFVLVQVARGFSLTSAAPTATPAAISATPTATAVGLTRIPTYPAPVVPLSGAGIMPATPVSQPDGQLLMLLWDDTTLYAANQSNTTIFSANVTFERVLTAGGSGERFDGQRWSAYWPGIEVNKCAVLWTIGGWKAPTKQCPNGVNVNVMAGTNEQFWTPRPNSTEFRILWGGKEVARCLIAQGTCSVYLPALVGGESPGHGGGKHGGKGN